MKRKLPGVLDILNSFPSSQFILVGDTGEQDLELYASLSALRPNQIVGVFLRDAGATDTVKSVDGLDVFTSTFSSIDDPTGERVQSDPELGGSFRGSSILIPGGTIVSEPETYTPLSSSVPSSTTHSSSSSSISSLRRSMSFNGRQPSLSPEKKRQDLQTRVWRARREIPAHIPLRVFRRPEECVEAREILERLNV